MNEYDDGQEWYEHFGMNILNFKKLLSFFSERITELINKAKKKKTMPRKAKEVIVAEADEALDLTTEGVKKIQKKQAKPKQRGPPRSKKPASTSASSSYNSSAISSSSSVVTATLARVELPTPTGDPFNMGDDDSGDAAVETPDTAPPPSPEVDVAPVLQATAATATPPESSAVAKNLDGVFAGMIDDKTPPASQEANSKSRKRPASPSPSPEAKKRGDFLFVFCILDFKF